VFVHATTLTYCLRGRHLGSDRQADSFSWTGYIALVDELIFCPENI
jgi:hypothetical protein